MSLDRQRWNRVWPAAVAEPEACDPFADLVARYAEPHRHYHDARHIAACLAAFDEVRDFASDPVALELALWFHDAVCDPRAADNEERSAVLAADALARASDRSDRRGRVERLILATKMHEASGDVDAGWMIDIDLAILGAGPAAFESYDAEIRAEYAWVEPAAYRERRAKVLEGFLGRARIYTTPYFHDRREAVARHNLTRALERLRGR